MTETLKKPSQSSRWLLLGVGLLLTAALYFDPLSWMVRSWQNEPDYSHGFLVPLFAAFILYSNRAQLAVLDDNKAKTGGVLWGILFVSLGVLLRLVGFYMRLPSIEGISLIAFVFGVFLLCLGAHVWRWAWAPILFLVFMIPLPSFLSQQLSGLLQLIATKMSAFTLQIMGFTAFTEGNVISLTNGEIGVAEACSGLRMLYSFFALTVGACLMIDRTWIEKCLIAFSAIPIAILSNCIRIVATGIAYQYFDSSTAEHFFHDIAGWLMMPLGFVFLLAVLAFLDRAIAVEQEEPDFA